MWDKSPGLELKAYRVRNRSTREINHTFEGRCSAVSYISLATRWTFLAWKWRRSRLNRRYLRRCNAICIPVGPARLSSQFSINEIRVVRRVSLIYTLEFVKATVSVNDLHECKVICIRIKIFGFVISLLAKFTFFERPLTLNTSFTSRSILILITDRI